MKINGRVKNWMTGLIVAFRMPSTKAISNRFKNEKLTK